MIAGAVSCVSSTADAFSRHIPVHDPQNPSVTVGPYTESRRGADGRTYVPLEDMRGNEYGRRDLVGVNVAYEPYRRLP